MSDTDRTAPDYLKTEQQDDQRTADRREFLMRGAITLGAGWLGLGGVRELLASSAAPAGVASMTGHALRAAIEEQQANQERLDRAIRQMEKYVRKNPDGTFELKAKNAEEVGIDQEAFEQLRLSLEKGNEFVRENVKAGRLRADEVRATTGRPEEDEPKRSGPPGGR